MSFHKIWTDPGHPAGFSSVGVLARAARKAEQETARYLQTQDAFSLTKNYIKKFQRRKIIARHVDELYQADLLDLSKYAKFNRGYRYVLGLVATLSKFVFYFPLKRKNAESMLEVLKKFLKIKTPTYLLTDFGTEFYAAPVKALLGKHGVHHYSTYNDDVKAAQIERQWRTLRTQIERYFITFGTKNWIDVIQSFADAYNRRVHSRTKIRPIDVNRRNENEIFNRLFPPSKIMPKQKFFPGDIVRILKKDKLFSKSAESKFTNELFKVKEMIPSIPIVYTLQDFSGETLKGTWYAQEMSKVLRPPEVQILKRQNRRGKRWVQIRESDGSRPKWVTERWLKESHLVRH